MNDEHGYASFRCQQCQDGTYVPKVYDHEPGRDVQYPPDPLESIARQIDALEFCIGALRSEVAPDILPPLPAEIMHKYLDDPSEALKAIAGLEARQNALLEGLAA